MSKVEQKVVAVSGAGSGIGRALALELASRGARLALSDVNEVGLAETAQTVESRGGEVHTTRVDVSDRAAVEAWADAVIDRFGQVHQIYNNAGLGGSGTTVLDSDWSSYQRMLSVNLWGVIHGTKVFLPHLIASGAGHVVNVSSLNGIMGQAGLSGYCASKFAVRGFTESLQAEMAAGKLPVRVTVVHPGGVKTNIASAVLAEAEAAGVQITDEQRARERMYSEKLLKLPAGKAAEIIVDAVEADRSRVLVGNDAKAVDTIVRLLPRHYTRIAAWYEKKFVPKVGA